MLLRVLTAVTAAAAAMGAVLTSSVFGGTRTVLLILSVPVGFLVGLAVQQGPLAYVRRNWVWVGSLCAVILIMLTAAKALGGLLNMTLAMGLQVLSGMATLRGGRRTKFGRTILSKTLGFQRYLAHVDRKELAVRLRQNGQFFYYLLPFAEAVGQGRVLAKSFGEMKLGPCLWLEGLRKPPRTAEAFYDVYRQLLRRMGEK